MKRARSKSRRVDIPLAELPLDRQCCVCGRVPRTCWDNMDPLQYCTSCRSNHRYCDEDCQRRGWNEHKGVCKMTCSCCKTIWSAKLPKCMCKKRRYCNRQCQILDWDARHSSECSPGIPWTLFDWAMAQPQIDLGYTIDWTNGSRVYH
jgi:hypothetical protein